MMALLRLILLLPIIIPGVIGDLWALVLLVWAIFAFACHVIGGYELN